MIADSLAEKMLFSTIRIEAWNSNERSVGTGFLFGYSLPDKRTIPFIITNRHVIEGYTDGKLRFTVKKDNKPDLGNFIERTISDFNKSWIFHKNKDIDLAMFPVMLHFKDFDGSSVDLFTQNISKEIIPSSELVNDLDALEDIVFVGYPDGLWDSYNNLPIIRKGITATPVAVDFESKPVFLIDASVFNGSSGSPVFIFNKGTIVDRQGNVQIGTRIIFLGVLAAAYYREEYKILETHVNKDEKGIEVNEMIDIGIVYKSYLVLEMIEDFLRLFGAIK